MIKAFFYDTILLSIVSIVVLILVLRNKDIKELLWFAVGVFVVAFSKIYFFLLGEHMEPAFYVTTAAGYFIISFSMVKLIGQFKLLKTIEEEAFHDPLTGAYNRSFIEEYIKEEVKKAKRLREQFCILLLDLNDFKQVNDKYGHNAGDMVLKMVVNELRRRLREYDLIARWGGDEFLVVLPAEKETNILEVANRLVSDFSVRYGNIDVTLSVGYACFPVDGSSLSKLIEVADSRMYKSKSILKEARRYAVDDKGEKKV